MRGEEGVPRGDGGGGRGCGGESGLGSGEVADAGVRGGEGGEELVGGGGRDNEEGVEAGEGPERGAGGEEVAEAARVVEEDGQLHSICNGLTRRTDGEVSWETTDKWALPINPPIYRRYPTWVTAHRSIVLCG